MGVNLDSTDKVFFSLQILVAQVVLIENPLDDIASPLGISSNMLIMAAITKILFLAFSPQLSMLATKERCLYPCFHGHRIRLDQMISCPQPVTVIRLTRPNRTWTQYCVPVAATLSFSPRGMHVPRDIWSVCVIFVFKNKLLSVMNSWSTGPIFTEYLPYGSLFDSIDYRFDSFSRWRKGRCHGNQF